MRVCRLRHTGLEARRRKEKGDRGRRNWPQKVKAIREIV